MKYDILEDYKLYLLNKYSEKTAKQYFNCVDRLLKQQQFSEPQAIDIESALLKLKNIEYANSFSQYKNALINYGEFAGLKLRKFKNETKRKKYRKLPERDLKDITAKINKIRDKKLMLSYKLMLATGLRVAELSNITALDVQKSIDGGYVMSFVAKGGERQQVEVLKPYAWICKHLQDVLNEKQSNEKLFYSERYLQEQAQKRGFACHDLRRAFAKITYQDSKSMEHTREKMRHKRVNETKIYLNSKINVGDKK